MSTISRVKTVLSLKTSPDKTDYCEFKEDIEHLENEVKKLKEQLRRVRSSHKFVDIWKNLLIVG